MMSGEEAGSALMSIIFWGAVTLVGIGVAVGLVLAHC